MSDKNYVLIVDDDPDARELLSAMVSATGLPVKSVGSGAQALERISEAIPAFVVLDLLMPEMDGFSVLGRLKLDPDKRDIPVLVVTGAQLDEEKETELRTLVLDIIYKSDLDARVIVKMIEDSVAGK